MPPHDETARVGSAGSVRRPPPARARAAGSGGSGAAGARRPAAGGRARTTASRDGQARPPARSGGGGGGRPPVRPPTGGGRPGGNGRGRPPGGGKKKRTAKQQRRRWYKVIAGTALSMFVLLGVFVGVVYASTDVPSPESVTNEQTTILYYSDGVTEMARLGSENRISVKLDEISEPARNAILAAENRSFYTDPGISFTGIVRAAWNNLTGGSTQGGSTITQQYVKNAILKNSEQSFSRKFKELFLAVKLDNSFSKDEILENYLNTIYFGRGAYGIEAAAETYFHVKAADLTAEQGAVLAVLVRSPSYYDPAANPEEAQDRWGRVLDAMVEQNWYDSAARAAAAYPEVQPKADSQLGVPSGPEGLIVHQVLDELTGPDFGYKDPEAKGLRVTTTVDKAYQDAAVAAVDDVMQGEDTELLRQALVAVDPKTGGVLAYYGNKQTTDDPAQDSTDYAQAYKQPGSSFKPYTLATALQNGFSVDTKRDGTSPQSFKDREKPVVNSGNAQCAACTLKQAITKSLNTTFYGLALDVGPAKVAAQARLAMGIGDTWPTDNSVPEDLRGKSSLASPGNGQTGGAIGIGEYEVKPIDQAVGFATLAAGGMYHQRHFVAQVADGAGTVKKTVTGLEHAQQAIPADVANDVTFAMDEVAKSSKLPLDGNRPVAAKTGTQGLNNVDNSDAWMVGYTPSISTAVWMGTKGNKAITNAQGKIIYGSGLPGQIWREFMNTVLAGRPKEPLPNKALIKGDAEKNVVEETTEAPPPDEAPAPTTQAPAPTTQAPAATSTAPVTSSESTSAANTSATTSSAGAGRPSFGMPAPGQPNG